VEFNCRGAMPRTDLDKMVRFHRLALVKSSKVEFSPASAGAPGAMFTPGEMRHNFAIWVLKKDTDFTRQRHLYYCIRCKQAFSVDDRSRSITPLDPHGDPIQGTEAAKRLATFSQGPCPAFSGLIAGQRLTPKVLPIRAVRGRFTNLMLAGCRSWKTVVGQWRRFSAQGGFPNHRSKRK
jgi:hypothetical protein